MIDVETDLLGLLPRPAFTGARRWYSKSEPKVLPAPTNAPGK
ncbi:MULTISPECIES: hypothetical protein [Corynebacterium]|nr:hypothetical protein [Corynebacterium sp. CTNIH16]MDV2426650.1 hypothetical protein [Corynebacterium sp. CTNIH16]